jgi:predicted DCC family thiol-disulfide oxidoreductase YuxK
MGDKGNENAVILFDGVCNLCNGAINFIIDRDKDRKFKFTSLQSEPGQELLQKFGLS